MICNPRVSHFCWDFLFGSPQKFKPFFLSHKEKKASEFQKTSIDFRGVNSLLVPVPAIEIGLPSVGRSKSEPSMLKDIEQVGLEFDWGEVGSLKSVGLGGRKNHKHKKHEWFWVMKNRLCNA